ncbi:MAG: molybdate ABC transporter substrate-binding protein [Opitutales bacterium]
MASLKRVWQAGRMFRVFLAFLLALPAAQAAETVRVAVAANLVQASAALNAAFRAAEPGIQLEVVFGSSGNLVAQITQGAPYDVFLSADLDYPRALIAAGQAEAETLTPFATGRLVLWTTRPGLAVPDLATALRDPALHTLAIANPATAPYGRAARETLEKLGLWAVLQPRLVIGENIGQTAQFVASGNADAGLVALSFVLSPQLADRGRWVEVPAADHAPLTQGAVLTRHGADHPAARRYLAFLRSAAARKVLERFGYGVPASP